MYGTVWFHLCFAYFFEVVQASTLITFLTMGRAVVFPHYMHFATVSTPPMSCCMNHFINFHFFTWLVLPVFIRHEVKLLMRSFIRSDNVDTSIQ